MQRIYCELILGAYCLFAFFYLPITTYTVAGLLAAITLLCLSLYFEMKALTAALSVCYILVGFFFPEIYLFFPILLTELSRMKLYPPMVLAALGFSMHFPPLDFLHLASHSGETSHSIFTRQADITLENLCYVLLGCIIALALDVLCTRIADLEQQYRKTRDDSAEHNFLLQERNRLLMEKQDYEVHTAMLQERNRIAREIHDNAGHMLSRCILLTGMIKTTNTDENCTDSLQLLDNELAKTMDTIRNSVHDLHKEAMNLEEKIRELLSDFAFCPVKFDYDIGTNIPFNIKYAFLAIIKESLTNIARHSNATNAQIRMTEHPAMFQLVISDNGTAPEQKQPLKDGIGLQNIRERVASLHGTLQIQEEKGFRIFISVPKAA